ncbi:MAG TPA: hypothetical protein VG168_12110 [Bryobacteraceae bacterium]|jgi:hypothetical protein|nr:hypothetical protein [Bryobacteraceae bacterium]
MGIATGVASDSGQRRDEEVRIEFLDRELDISQTFLDTAVLEASDPERCEVAKRNARIGYDTVLTWIGSVKNAEAMERLNVKLARLKGRLEEHSC